MQGNFDAPRRWTTLVVVPSLAFAVSMTALLAESAKSQPDPAPATTVSAGRTVQLRVEADPASNPAGYPLHFRWRASDGSIRDVDSASTDWTLPPGGGLHFAYVQISNGHGGYEVARYRIDSDPLGGHSPAQRSRDFEPPADGVTAADTPTNFFRGYAYGGAISAGDGTPTRRLVYLPDVDVFLYPAGSKPGLATPVGHGRTGLSGDFTVANVPAGLYDLYCAMGSRTPRLCQQRVRMRSDDDLALPGNTKVFATNAGDIETMAAVAFGDYVPQASPTTTTPQWYTGTVLLDRPVFEKTDAAGAPSGGQGRTESPCGTVDPFFGTEVAATVRLLRGPTVLASARVNAYGDFALPYDPAATAIEYHCENLERTIPLVGPNAAPVKIVSVPGVSGKLFQDDHACEIEIPGTADMAFAWELCAISDGTYYTNTLPRSAADEFPVATVTPAGPIVLDAPRPSVRTGGFVATLGGTPIGDAWPRPTLMDGTPMRSDVFLAYKGIDSAKSACLYYRAIGAVKGCKSDGSMQGAITFDDWQRKVAMGAYVLPGYAEQSATFVNKVDLNLTRNHHSIAYPDRVAAYVCNHPGPVSAAYARPSDDPAAVDAAIAVALANRSLLGCVAMDYASHPGANAGKPFVRFLVFSPSGQLLSSLNLDGLGEKFVPGTCVACHGGDRYAGAFPSDGSGKPDIGARFLPYDKASFLFAGLPDHPELAGDSPAMIDALRRMNANLLATNISEAQRELIDGLQQSDGNTYDGWYAHDEHGGLIGDQNAATEFVPPDWDASTWFGDSAGEHPGLAPDTDTAGPIALYRGLARNCRTCHAAYPAAFNLHNAWMPIGDTGTLTPLMGSAQLRHFRPGDYSGAVAFSCSACHSSAWTNPPPSFDPKHVYNWKQPWEYRPDGVTQVTCGPQQEGVFANFRQNAVMPNSLVTFNRFWANAADAKSVQNVLLNTLTGYSATDDVYTAPGIGRCAMSVPGTPPPY